MIGSLSGETFAVLLVIVVGLWLAQFFFAYRQMQQFYRRLKQLRRDGLTAVGRQGNRVRGRTYAVLVVDSNNRVLHAEGLRGLTVFAGLRPFPTLVGMGIDDLIAHEGELPVPPSLRAAFGNAARDLAAARTDTVGVDLPEGIARDAVA